MTKYFYIFLIVVFASCKKNEVKIKVNACFNYSSETTLKVGDTIQFSNCSENADFFQWDFGDGTTSFEKMPYHVYEKKGNFTIKLKAINNLDFDTISKNISLDGMKIKACFDYSLESILSVGDTIQFSNCSENANSFIWDFGDGSISNEKLPLHVYQKVGIYTVKLYVTNLYSIDTISKPVFVIDRYFTDLHDKWFRPEPGYRGENKFNLDIDRDSINDVQIKLLSFHGSHSLAEDYVGVTPLNGFKIAFSETTSEAWSKCDSNYIPSIVKIPKKFILGDTIFIDSNFTQNSLMIYYNKQTNNNLNTCPSYLKYSIQGSSNYYLAFYKENGLNYKVAWLKVLQNSVSGIQISSCYYSISQSLIIDR